MRHLGVEHVEVDVQIDAANTSRQRVEGCRQRCARAALDDRARGDPGDVRVLDAAPLLRVEIARAQQQHVSLRHGHKAGDRSGDRAPAVAHGDREPHAVDEPGGRGFGRVEVAVGVEPEDADRIGAEPGERAEAAVAVARQYEGCAPFAYRLAYPRGQDAVQLEGGADLHRELAGCLDRGDRYVVPEIGELPGEAAVDEVLRAASHACATVARVVGDLDNLDLHLVAPEADGGFGLPPSLHRSVRQRTRYRLPGHRQVLVAFLAGYLFWQASQSAFPHRR